MTRPSPQRESPRRGFSPPRKSWRALWICRLLQRITGDSCWQIIDHRGTCHDIGPGGPPRVIVRIDHPSFYRAVVRDPIMAVGEAYTDGRLRFEKGQITDLAEIFFRSPWAMKSRSTWWGRARHTLRQYAPAWLARPRVRYHYDTPREVFETFLDRHLQYSCAYFRHSSMSLEEAQRDKMDRIADKLLLDDGMEVLDIGSGWGGLAHRLARRAKVDVLGITLSRQQHRYAEEKSRRLGLDRRVSFQVSDYRQVRKRFDRIVSVGMLEHVGIHHYRTFFSHVRDLLKDDGVALIHSIVRMDPPTPPIAWFDRYIFPGAYNPSLSQLTKAIEHTGLWITDIECWRRHYAHTLKAWREGFWKHRQRIEQLCDEKFFRMWDMYLGGCEMYFRHGMGMVAQIQLARRAESVPFTRDYLSRQQRSRHPDDTSAAA